jgi:uncharacterized membrane protein
MLAQGARRTVGRAPRVLAVLLVLYVAVYGMRYVVLGRWAWIPMLAASFEQRPWAIMLHALGGSLVLTAGLLQFHPGLRRRVPAFHRAAGWLYAAAALLAGGAGLHLAAHSAGGWPTHLGFGLLGLATLGTTAHATRLAVRRELPAHRRWMVRSYALGVRRCDAPPRAPAPVGGLRPDARLPARELGVLAAQRRVGRVVAPPSGLTGPDSTARPRRARAGPPAGAHATDRPRQSARMSLR